MATPPTTQQLMEEAAGWLAALDAGSAAPEAFAQWRAGDPRRAVAFAQVVDALEQVERLRAVHEREPAPPPRVERRLLLRAAALAGGASVAGAFIAVQANARESASTITGERRTIILDDGTRVHLNTATGISWRIDGTSRSVWLDEGEIRLEVKPRPPGSGAGHPLRLIVAGANIRLDAGIFNVRRQPESVGLLVLSGRAALDGRRMVDAGSLAQVIGKSVSVRPAETIAIARAQSWRNGQLVFEGESLDFVVAEFNRYLDHKIVIADPSLSRIRLGGRFTTTDPADLLTALQASFGIRSVRGDTGAITLTTA
ncbi:FecR family protein [Sphingobium scionense]|uniref:Transmembrane sensor n=2 Tax=Sphingobium scionense TaxID=1404341 RepID=A0A7W6LWK4_9SPHN|nr:FecR domain-containing protein [Sphingobium scionense]MBB4151804.1 transmembrane sensor [Sphingobium scionense]